MCGKQLGRERLIYSELTKTSTALPRLAVLSVLSAARRLVLIFVNSLYCCEWPGTICVSYTLHTKKGYLKNGLSCFQVAF